MLIEEEKKSIFSLMNKYNSKENKLVSVPSHDMGCHCH